MLKKYPYRFKFLYRVRYLVIVSVILSLMNYWGTRIIFNPSISEPRGYYFIFKRTEYKKNMIVQICINNKDYLEVLRKLKVPFHNRGCKSSIDYLLKTIVAGDGDKVLINQRGVFINGVLQHNSNAINNFRGINLYPTKDRRFIVGKNEFFVLGKTQHSYDSRYFGIIKESQIAAEAYLVYETNQRIW